jgi:phosphatidate phosphatase LPIN
MAALRREVYLRKPEVFKMACLRDIMNLFTFDTPPSLQMPSDSKHPTAFHQRTPFYAGFGNRLTDALSYRSVAIPPTRIFTINSNAEVSLHLLTLNSYRTSYLSIWELVDHYFPPVGLLVKDGGEEYTDFNYWRDRPSELADDFSSDEEEEEEEHEDEEYDDDRPFILDDETDMEASFMSHATSGDEATRDSGILDTVEEDLEMNDHEADTAPHHHLQPETILEEAEEEDEEEYGPDGPVAQDESERQNSPPVVDEHGDLLVEESRQLQALDLAAEESSGSKHPATLTRWSTVPDQTEGDDE